MARKSRVAIIGGGCGSIAAAYELSKTGKYDITVYQMGWRLGGKGASGRGAAGRIEEHALHVWLGFYENAFRLLRDCYVELSAPEGSLVDADDWKKDFIADSFVGVADEHVWTAYFPPAPGLPGDPIKGGKNPFTLRAYMVQALKLVRALLMSVEGGPGPRRSKGGGLPLPGPEREGISIRQYVRDIVALVKTGVLSVSAGLVSLSNMVEKAIETFPVSNDYVAAETLREIAAAVRDELEPLVHSDKRFLFRWQILDLVQAIIVGSVREGLLTDDRGLDALNDQGCREWLKKHGALESSVDSAFNRGLFNLALAQGHDIAAGQALRGALRMFFTYRGALFWKLRAGMGDVVFAPFYQVLSARGVKFKFFHRLENVRMHFAEPDSDDSTYVEALEFDIQAQLKSSEYSPLITVKGRSCWPSQPDYAQLRSGPALADRDFESFWDRRYENRLTLKVGHDFDFVVLGIGVGAIRYACKEIVEDTGDVGVRWKGMVEKVETTATQSLQIWLRKDMADVGWTKPPVTLSGLQSVDLLDRSNPAAAIAFDTWADMGQVIPAEDWPDPWPRSAAYFCGPLAEPLPDDPRSPHGPAQPVSGTEALAYVRRRRTDVLTDAQDFLSRELARIWPGAYTRTGFDWTLLVDPAAPSQPHTTPSAAVGSQYWSANINPSDRYVLAPPGSMRARISPLDASIDNMTLAGDWTDCGFNEGCVEAAFISGRLAAHAISRSPKLEDIVGYDHP